MADGFILKVPELMANEGRKIKISPGGSSRMRDQTLDMPWNQAIFLLGIEPDKKAVVAVSLAKCHDTIRFKDKVKLRWWLKKPVHALFY